MTFRQIQPVLTATPCIILQKHAGRKPLPEGGRAYPVGIARVPARKDQGESAGREGVFGPQNRIRRRGNQVEADARDHHVAPFFDQDAAKLAPAAARLPCARPLIGFLTGFRTRFRKRSFGLDAGVRPVGRGRRNKGDNVVGPFHAHAPGGAEGRVERLRHESAHGRRGRRVGERRHGGQAQRRVDVAARGEPGSAQLALAGCLAGRDHAPPRRQISGCGQGVRHVHA